MPVYQTNLWVCEKCGNTDSTANEVSPYSDPVVAPAASWGNGWEYVVYCQPDMSDKELLVCPECYSAKEIKNE